MFENRHEQRRNANRRERDDEEQSGQERQAPPFRGTRLVTAGRRCRSHTVLTNFWLDVVRWLERHRNACPTLR